MAESGNIEKLSSHQLNFIYSEDEKAENVKEHHSFFRKTTNFLLLETENKQILENMQKNIQKIRDKYVS